jgi:hypothetical protein
MCLTRVTKKYARPHGDRWVRRWKVFATVNPSSVNSFWGRGHFLRGIICIAGNGHIYICTADDNYPEGFHCLPSKNDAKNYGRGYDWEKNVYTYNPILSVQVKGLVAAGYQGKYRVEVYKYMRVPKGRKK